MIQHNNNNYKDGLPLNVNKQLYLPFTKTTQKTMVGASTYGAVNNEDGTASNASSMSPSPHRQQHSGNYVNAVGVDVSPGHSDQSSSVSPDNSSHPSPTLKKPHHIAISLDDPYPEEETLLDPPMTPHTYETLRRAFFTMFPLFMGYAAMVTLQDNIKTQLGIGDNSSHESYEFSFATSLLYLGNLIFRLLHNIIFSFMRPRYRVVVAYVCMTIATGLLGLVYYVANSKSIVWVYVAYLLGGVAVGTFESNLISTITPLGHGTKVWAQYGIPVGFNGVSVGAFILFASFPGNLDLQCGVYLFISVANMLGMIFFLFAIPDVVFESTHKTIGVFIEDVKKFREWAPLIWKHAFSLAVDMFAVSFGSAIQLYIYDTSLIPLWLGAAHHVNKNVFRAIFNSCSLLGDATGRKLAYYTHRHVTPFWFLISTVVGVSLILSKQSIVAPLGMFCVMFANGSIYAHTTKYVDDKVNHKYNLISLSAWLFIGDVGSFTGSNLVNSIRVLIGNA